MALSITTAIPRVKLARRSGHEDVFTVSLVREVIRREPVRWSMEGDVLVLTFNTLAPQVPLKLRFGEGGKTLEEVTEFESDVKLCAVRRFAVPPPDP